MANLNEVANGKLEWRIRLAGSSTEILATESSHANSFSLSIELLSIKMVLGFWKCLKKVWYMGMDDPTKVIHCAKVGIALSVVSLFYYMRPLYDGIGGNAMWAVMTVVVVFEHTVGATIYKCLNRAIGTSLAGFLAVGIHWIATRSGEKLEPFIMGVAVFVLASATTFLRFIPAVKARFDYGALIFILTFSLVSVSGYRVDKLLHMAQERFSTIVIGTSLCILTSMFIFPIWAGEKLHLLIACNMEKLADSLDCCTAEYFSESSEETVSICEESAKRYQAYKCVLNSKATEESMANYARWEPGHGQFSFQHPWRQYLKIGTFTRKCACCIEALNTCISSKKQDEPSKSTAEFIDERLTVTCLKVSSCSSRILRDLAASIKSMTRSSTLDISVDEMNNVIEELQNYMKDLPALILFINPETEKAERVLATNEALSLPEIIPLVTFASLLIESARRVEDIVDAVQELASMAEFRDVPADKTIENHFNDISVHDQRKDEETIQ
ncbi:hypothetical protein Pfo_025778 [Paulownia fortunei]|nr:hypothetical protein Pfo_025778 [Paulownia fortunei]